MCKMEKRVRVPKNDYRDGEYMTFCGKCDCELAVLPPESLLKKARKGNEEGGYDWLDKRYFYCPKCQRKNDLSETEVSE